MTEQHEDRYESRLSMSNVMAWIWTVVYLLITVCPTSSSASSICRDTELIAQLRKELEVLYPDVQQPWIPLDCDGFRVSLTCKQHGKGCTNWYVEWLQSKIAAKEHVEAAVAVRKGDVELKSLTKLEALHLSRQIGLLTERREQLERTVQRLNGQLSERRRRNSWWGCDRWHHHVDISLWEGIHVQVLQVTRSSMQWLPYLLYCVFPCTIAVVILVWMCFERGIPNALFAAVPANPAVARRLMRHALRDALRRARLLMLLVIMMVLAGIAKSTVNWIEKSWVGWVMDFVMPGATGLGAWILMAYAFVAVFTHLMLELKSALEALRGGKNDIIAVFDADEHVAVFTHLMLELKSAWEALRGGQKQRRQLIGR